MSQWVSAGKTVSRDERVEVARVHGWETPSISVSQVLTLAGKPAANSPLVRLAGMRLLVSVRTGCRPKMVCRMKTASGPNRFPPRPLGEGNRCRDHQRRGRSEGVSFLGQMPFRPFLSATAVFDTASPEGHAFPCPTKVIPLFTADIQRPIHPSYPPSRPRVGLMRGWSSHHSRWSSPALRSASRSAALGRLAISTPRNAAPSAGPWCRRPITQTLSRCSDWDQVRERQS